MGRPADPRRESAVRIIRDLTLTHGVVEGCLLARKQFSDVPVGTWGRWRSEAVGAIRAQRKTDSAVARATASRVPDEIPTLLQVAPPQDAIPAVRRAIDFWRLLGELDEDARLMRSFAVTQNPDGSRKLRVPFALRDAHRMRADLIRLAMQHAETSWRIGRDQEFQDAVIAEIAAESPDMQRRILERLRRLAEAHAERGLYGQS